LISNRADIFRGEFYECLRPTRCANELDLEPVGLIDLDDCTKIAASETVLRNVTIENHGVEGGELHNVSPGYAVTNREVISPCFTIHTVATTADFPDGPVSVAETSYLFPNRLNLPSTAARDRTMTSRSRCNSAQFASVYPRDAKNTDLNLPTG
jgi:hypothetical protein